MRFGTRQAFFREMMLALLSRAVIDLLEVTFPTAGLIYAQDAPVFGLFCFFGSMWDLSLLARDRTHTPCIGSLES